VGRVEVIGEWRGSTVVSVENWGKEITGQK
jgi:hypothetical protein